jgi:hypothetical protein
MVHVDQAGGHDGVAGVDDPAVAPGLVRLDRGDAMPLDDDVINARTGLMSADRPSLPEISGEGLPDVVQGVATGGGTVERVDRLCQRLTVRSVDHPQPPAVRLLHRPHRRRVDR